MTATLTPIASAPMPDTSEAHAEAHPARIALLRLLRDIPGAADDAGGALDRLRFSVDRATEMEAAALALRTPLAVRRLEASLDVLRRRTREALDALNPPLRVRRP